MTTTVSYYMPEFSQGTLGDDSGMKIKLSKPSDRSAVNGAGDALLWAGNSWLTAVVEETWTETLAASVVDSDGLIPRSGWLGVGSTIVSDVVAELDSVTAAKLDSILEDTGTTLPAAIDAIDNVTASVAAFAARLALEVQLRGFPNVICRNSDYVEETESEIRVTVEDLTGAAITEIAGTPVASLEWLLGMGTEKEPRLISGTCSWDSGPDELVIEIPKSSTVGKQTGALTWQIGVKISDNERWLGGGTTRLIERQF